MKTLSIAAMLAALLHVGAGTSVAQTGFAHDPFAYGGAPGGGMMLGIYAVETIQGMRVMNTIDGCSAHGRLLPNDVLLRATAVNLPTFSINSHDRLEYAKAMIGANREAAIEFFRPGVGTMYAWLTFELQGDQGHLTGLPGMGSTFQAQFLLESEKPGARELFIPAPAAIVIPAVTTEVAPAATVAPATAAPAIAAPATPDAAAPADAAIPAAPAETEQPSEPAASEDSLDALFN